MFGLPLDDLMGATLLLFVLGAWLFILGWIINEETYDEFEDQGY